MEVAQAIGVKGTPTFVWRKTDGTEGRIDGLPASVPDLLASVGS
jgi:thiol:disulfide interchange protein DsbG